MKALEKRIILYYTGEPHTSGNMVSAQVSSYLKNKKKSKESLDTLKNIAFQMRDAVKSENIEDLGRLLTKDWREKTEFNPLITTDYMRKLHEIIMKNGGIGGRVCGAGGGGCMFWIVNLHKKEEIISKLNKQAGKPIHFEFISDGLQISNI